MTTPIDSKFTYVSANTGFYDEEGVWKDNGLLLDTARGTIQPMSGKDLLSYDSSGRTTGMVKIYSSEQLKVRERGGSSGSWIKFNGSLYEVVQEMAHRITNIGHYKYVACLADENVPVEVKELLGL